jgi:hypothetical protein
MLQFIVIFTAFLIIITLICIKLILVPGSTFHGTCSTNNVTNKDGSCSFCGKKADEACKKDDMEAEQSPA